MRHYLIIKVLNYRILQFVPIVDFCLEQILVFNAPRSLIEQLRLLIFILNGLCKSSKRTLLVYREPQDFLNLVLLLVQFQIDRLNTIEWIILFILLIGIAE